MRTIGACLPILACIAAWFLAPAARAAETFRVAEYNVDNYLDRAEGNRPIKSAAAKAKVIESILALQPDVLGLEEMGSTNALLELRAALQSAGLDLPHWEWIEGFDTNIHVAVLSRFPFTARHPHTNDTYLLTGRRFTVNRGFAELEIQVNPRYSFTLFAGHLKSRRAVPEADEAEMREQEALLLREKIEARLAAHPDANLLVLGDLNDVRDAKSTRAILGRANAKNGLVDTRPAERNGDALPGATARSESRNITWTYFYSKEDTYSRIDYILLSHGMAKEWLKEETYILSLPNWGVGSDHRPITAAFVAEDK